MSKTKTAVEWLVDELQREEWIPKEDSGVAINYLISAAKEMERSRYTEIAQEVAESCTEFYERKNKKNEQD